MSGLTDGRTVEDLFPLGVPTEGLEGNPSKIDGLGVAVTRLLVFDVLSLLSHCDSVVKLGPGLGLD